LNGKVHDVKTHFLSLPPSHNTTAIIFILTAVFHVKLGYPVPIGILLPVVPEDDLCW